VINTETKSKLRDDNDIITEVDGLLSHLMADISEIENERIDEILS
jgi:hypothetical protein